MLHLKVAVSLRVFLFQAAASGHEAIGGTGTLGIARAVFSVASPPVASYLPLDVDGNSVV